MAKKIEKAKNLGNWLWDLDNDLKTIITRLQKITKDYPDYHRFSFSVDQGYHGSTTVDLVGYRWETDAEYATRMKSAKALRVRTAEIKAKKLAAERAMYEKLKKKFEKE